MFEMKSFIVLVAWIAIALATYASATADPQLTVKPARATCDQPFEATATGLPPLKPVEVVLTTFGQAATGGVGGTSDADGVFISPFPRINIPCESGGIRDRNRPGGW